MLYEVNKLDNIPYFITYRNLSFTNLNMAKSKKITTKKTAIKKSITVYAVVRVILITLACSIMILGIVVRFIHYFNNH